MSIRSLLISLALLGLLAANGEATCQTYFDYCTNITLPIDLGGTNTCRQISPTTSGACNAPTTGTHSGITWNGQTNGDVIVDGNLNTCDRPLGAGDAYLYFNYTKPADTSSAIASVWDGDGVEHNFTVSAGCWSTYSDIIRFQLYAFYIGPAINVQLACWSSGSYSALGQYQTNNQNAVCEEPIYWGFGQEKTYQINLDSLLCSASSCTSSTICKNSDGQCYVSTNAQSVYVSVANSGDAAYGVTYSTPKAAFNNLGSYPSNTTLVTNITYCALGRGLCTKTSYLTVCLNGSVSQNLGYQNFIPDYYTQTATLVPSSFTSYYRRNWSFYDENTAVPISFTGTNATLNVYCDNYGVVTYNSTQLPASTGSLTIQTYERPRFVLNYNNQLRIREDVDHYITDRYYVQSTGSLKYSIQLYDYTSGQFFRSTLLFQRNINDTWDNVDVQRFGTDNLLYLYLQNNTQYKVTLKTDVQTRDLEYFTPDGVILSKALVVNSPLLNGAPGIYKDTAVYCWSSFAASSIYCFVNTSTSTVNTTFTVTDTTTSPYTQLYSSSQTGTVLYSYTLSDPTKVVIVQVDIVHPTYGSSAYSQMIQLYNQTSPLNGSAFSQPTPAAILGEMTKTWKKMFAVFIVWFVLFVGCKISDYGIGAITASLFYSGFWWINWIPQDEVPWIFCIMMIIASASLKFFERRYV